MSDLAEFLRARYDEDEREIRSVLQPSEPSPQLSISHRAMHMVLTHELEAAWPTGSPRMFVDVESKRRIVDLHGDQHECTDTRASGYPYVGCETVRLLALPYADHPDYHEEWTP